MEVSSFLGIDPGSTSAACLLERGTVVFNDVWSLSGAHGSRGLQLGRHVRRTLDVYQPTVVVYEDASFAVKKLDEARLRWGLAMILQVGCEQAHVPYYGVPPATLKKYGADFGYASKRKMLEAAIEEGGDPAWTHDQVDAYWCARFAETEVDF